MTIDKQTLKLGSRILENLPRDMSDDVMQGWIDNPSGLQKFLAGLCPVKVKQAQKHLVRHGEVKLPRRRKVFDPHEFFQTRDGLWVSDDFRNRILSVAKKIKTAPAAKFGSFNLAKAANDGEIRAELPKGHIFENASEFCAYLADMIDAQPGGKDGDLLSNGSWNIFYVRGVGGEVFAVRAYWHDALRKWLVSAFTLGDCRRDAGSRALSSNC